LTNRKVFLIVYLMKEALKYSQENSDRYYFGLGLKVYNQVQIALAKRFGRGNKEKEAIWFERYQNEIGGTSGKFRGLLESRPDLIALIRTDFVAALEKIEEGLTSL